MKLVKKIYKKMFVSENIADVFSKIYEKKIWLNTNSLSGEGSEIYYTENLRRWLIEAVSTYKIRKIVDAPCGDFNWMKLVLPEVEVEYIGYDIVETVIDENKQMYEDEKITFKVADICKDDLPDCDLLMVRDCLFHLSYKDVDKFLTNISKVNFKYLLTTTHEVDEGFLNKDIETGGFRKIDLFKTPFNFNPKTIINQVDDYPEGFSLPRQMVLIKKSDVPLKLVL